MTVRSSKQFLYGAFYLSVIFGISSLIYFSSLRPEPSCFDGIQNQGENGVDCGGPCARQCLPAGLRPIQQVERILSLTPAPGRMSVLARVSNPNFEHAARSFRYDFSLIGFDGEVVASFSGNSFLYAAEAKYILVPNVVAPVETFSRIDLKISDIQWVPRSEFPGLPKLYVSAFETRIDGNILIVDGRITNDDVVVYPQAKVVSLFYGQFGQIAGASETTLGGIAPNETRQFSVIYPFIPNVDLAATRVFVYAERQ